MMKRRASRLIRLGNVDIGGSSPISVQSMTKTDTRDIGATVRQIRSLEDCGCEIVRVAVPDSQAASALAEIKRQTSIPVVADIHFDYRVALAALKAGADGLRLNPGNIRDAHQISMVVQAARERQIPIRIGVNAGSLPPTAGPDLSVVQRMVRTALDEIRLFEELDFELIKVSVKAFDVPKTIEAYEAVGEAVPYPLHLGITEAGLPASGAIRSSVGLGILLHEGLGDTIRVSLTTLDPCEEVRAAYEILKALDLRERGPVLVSCPSCGRSESDIVGLAKMVEERLKGVEEPIKVAVMGCVVNGPGEAKDADVGIACGKGRGVIFKGGEKVRTVQEEDFLTELMGEIGDLLKRSRAGLG